MTKLDEEVNRLVSRALLAEQNAKLGVLIVEGDADYRLIRAHRNSNEGLAILPVQGKPKVLKAARLYSQRTSLNKVVFSVDSDFDSFCGAEEPSTCEHLVKSRGHDHFMDMVLDNSPALLKTVKCLLNERTNEDWVENDYRETVTEAMALAKMLVPFRIVNEIEKHGLLFDGLEIKVVEDADRDLVAISNYLIGRKNSLELSEELLVAQVEAVLAKLTNDQHRQLVGDHDFWAALIHRLKARKVGNLPEKRILSIFIENCGCQAFRKTELYQCVQQILNSDEIFSCPECGEFVPLSEW